MAREAVLRFRHDVIEGSPYEAGRWQGEAMSGNDWRWAFTQGPPDITYLAADEGKKALAIVERYCPGVADEIQGASDATAIPIEKMTFLGSCRAVDGRRTPTLWDDAAAGAHASAGACSHFYLPRNLNPDGHIRLGCNLDNSPMMQELRLCTTRIAGKPAHISFSDCVFGRFEGLNEYGFGFTSSLGCPWAQMHMAASGLPASMVGRILLDRCASVPEALDTLAGLPIAAYSNLILADRSGDRALAEIACSRRAVRRLGRGDAQALFATNHYVLPEMDEYAPLRLAQSVRRYGFLEAELGRSAAPIARPHDLLGPPYPEGLRVPYYDDGLGTLESMVLDLDTLTADVSFGPPSLNPWHRFDLSSPKGSTLYNARILVEPAPEGLWDAAAPEAS
ncbi:MAG: C45 family autoproteolytic acyltransferase/hydrolase [Candidatus Bipolaricaulia bacterium]